MSKFNTKKENNKAVSYEGGSVYNKNLVEDYLNNLFSSFIEDGFYESQQKKMERFLDLTTEVRNQLGNEFLAKTSVFARNELGMRSTSQLIASYLNDEKFDNKRAYYRNFCHRPDDVAEIFGAIDMMGQKRSHATVRGCGDYLAKLNEYQLGKYKMLGKEYNMYDLINITHAKSFNVDSFMKGEIESPDTWEVKISVAKTDAERAEEWIRLVKEDKLGYLAFISNLNNILNAMSTLEIDDRLLVEDKIVSKLTDEVSIKKSLVFPYKIYRAYKNMKVHPFTIDEALDKAFRIACGNMEKFEGKSVIMLDISGSMENTISSHSNITIKEVGACYAAALYISQDCDFVKFGTNAKLCSYNKIDNIFNIISNMCEEDKCGYGTYIGAAFAELDKKYDRIFIVSDMQIMKEDRNQWWYTKMADGPANYN
ncbi:MAG: TROVE domain-containing protein, partial [Holdemanella biformis]|nr:TROVE domain-containing protein [Holdemanella biformis]